MEDLLEALERQNYKAQGAHIYSLKFLFLDRYLHAYDQKQCLKDEIKRQNSFLKTLSIVDRLRIENRNIDLSDDLTGQLKTARSRYLFTIWLKGFKKSNINARDKMIKEFFKEADPEGKVTVERFLINSKKSRTGRVNTGSRPGTIENYRRYVDYYNRLKLEGKNHETASLETCNKYKISEKTLDRAFKKV